METLWPLLFLSSWLLSCGEAAPNGNGEPEPPNIRPQSAVGPPDTRSDESNPQVPHPDAPPPIAQRPAVPAPPVPSVLSADNNIIPPKPIPTNSNQPPAALSPQGPLSSAVAAMPPKAPPEHQMQEEHQRQEVVPEAAASKQELQKNPESLRQEQASTGEEEDLPTINDSADSSRVVEGMGENRIAAEIADLQRKLGDLQSNIDQVLNEGSRKKREAEKADDVVTMGKQLDELLKTVGNDLGLK